MSAPRPVEVEYLSRAEAALVDAVGSNNSHSYFELRLQILEAASARFGGFNLKVFHKEFGIKSKLKPEKLLELAAPVVSAIENSPIHPALALSALARESLHEHDRKNTGAYHTDFRLATRLAKEAALNLTNKSKVIDPACGAGILLAALTNEVCGKDRTKTAHWLAHSVFAADLSENSLRAALLALASFTDDISALKAMRNRWYCGDSLMADCSIWKVMAPDGFDTVIGNPPWEKIKISRHEFLKSSGTKRHYGEQINKIDEGRFAQQRDEAVKYSHRLLQRYSDLGNGEPDLYIAFTNLFFELCKELGTVAVLIPGGFIRSQGTQATRKKIFERSQRISVSIIDNRARFFSIDTRFKFLAVVLTKASPEKLKRDPIILLHEHGSQTGMEITGKVTIGRSALLAVRSDFSLPEVRNLSEWKLFSKIANAGVSWDDPCYGWKPKFCREVDMTKERPKFLTRPIPGALPLIEGRMVQAHRLGVKGYISGSGRKAIWKTYPIGDSRLSPQFWIRQSDIPKVNQSRTDDLRVGFCDIAGQTNERSLMAAIITSGVACGNKVPTIIFPEDLSEDRLLVWVSIANSFVFDWMLRRVITTTVNYFLLESIPMPRLTKNGLPWKKLVSSAREIRKLNGAGFSTERCLKISQLRAKIDAEVAVAYGLDLKDMELILQDFPIIDRGQPALSGEDKSTITRDSVLDAVAKRIGVKSATWSLRAKNAHILGALSYVPSELALGSESINDKGTLNHG